MGHITHHAIIVTGHGDLLHKARDEARRIFNPWTGPTVPEMVSTSFGSATNGYGTFVVGPDGSKSGWSTSDEADGLREQFKEWLKTQRYSDGSSSLEWVEVRYGADDAGNDVYPSVTDHEWKHWQQSDEAQA